MKTILLTVLTATALMALPDVVKADSSRFVDYAEVTEVVPLVSRKQVSTPRESCEMVRTVAREERRRHYRDDRRQHDAEELVPTLLGGLVGGVIGNQFGGGNGKKALTVLGALAGASIANEASQPSRSYRHADNRRSKPRYVERCRVFHEVEEFEEVVGYQVTYEYLGRTFTRTVDVAPGDQIRIHVELEPLAEPAYADISTSM